MSTTAARISNKRGNELFTVDTINTPRGKRYALVSHREKIGQDKRTIQQFEFTPFGLERAKRIAKKFREDAEATRNERT